VCRSLLAQLGISDFQSKKDLINACMASSHVPFFLDFKLTRSCRGRQCVDGSFPDFFTGACCSGNSFGWACWLGSSWAVKCSSIARQSISLNGSVTTEVPSPAGLNSELLRRPAGASSSAIIFDYFDDAALTRRGRMDMLEIKRQVKFLNQSYINPQQALSGRSLIISV
jgi:hypothetical protein